MKGHTSHSTWRNQPRTTHTPTPPNKILELHGKESILWASRPKKIFYKENKSDRHHSDSDTYARKKKGGSNIVKTKKTKNWRFYTQLNFKYKDQKVFSTWKKGVRIHQRTSLRYPKCRCKNGQWAVSRHWFVEARLSEDYKERTEYIMGICSDEVDTVQL